jgi:hypothetical protein
VATAGSPSTARQSAANSQVAGRWVWVLEVVLFITLKLCHQLGKNVLIEEFYQSSAAAVS